MSENQKLYEDFMRKFNLTTPSSLLAIEHIITTINPSSTEDVPTYASLTEDGYTHYNNPTESILSADGAVEEFFLASYSGRYSSHSCAIVVLHISRNVFNTLQDSKDQSQEP